MITEYFPLRRSNRNVPAARQKEKQFGQEIGENDSTKSKACEPPTSKEIEEELNEDKAKKEVEPIVNKTVKVVKAEKIKEHLTVRRSGRKPASILEKERQIYIQEAILIGKNESLLYVYTDKVKGRGIKGAVAFKKDDFVVEYKGNLIVAKLAAKLEAMYSRDASIGSYMYYFKHKGKSYCVDATEESPFKGRLINHSVLKPNLKTKVVDCTSSFHLVLIAIRDIEEGEELLFDYGDRTKTAVAANPWLRST
uniref:[histone H4]-lysine(20) N-methyltransferase n=1 Tax=Rhabditophanes sp. KR3021 TaxID=114890 RepID=A0AC35TRF0_9BILA